MELTPIRVRGARSQQKRRQRAPGTSNVDDDVSGPGTQSFSRFALAKRTKSSVRSQMNKRLKRPLSTLECLPTEIIQLIFEHCNNPSLPLASLAIAKQLSDQRVYCTYALNVLYCTLACLPREQPNLVSGTGSLQWDYEKHHAGCAAEVTTLLRHRWMSWTLFQKVVQTAYDWAQLDHVDIAKSFTRPNFAQPSIYCFDHYMHCCLSSRTRSGGPVQLPWSLVQGPWTSDKAAFLHYLVWHEVTIDWNRSTLGEVATLGLQQAIAARNQLVVATLVCTAVLVTPSIDMVRSAVIEHGCDRTIVLHLLAAALRSQIDARSEAPDANSSSTDVSFRDPSLWSWISRMKSDDGRGETATWLKEALRCVADIASGRSVYDQVVYEEVARACGQKRDGVKEIKVPWRRRNHAGALQTIGADATNG